MSNSPQFSCSTVYPVCRGVRGATTVCENSADEIEKSARELLALLIRANGIEPDDVASIVFSTTPDLNASFPSIAARQFGWNDVAMMCVHELDVPDALPCCLRILIHWNTTKPASEIKHVYIKDAASLRPEFGENFVVDWEELDAWIEQRIVPLNKSTSNSQNY